MKIFSGTKEVIANGNITLEQIAKRHGMGFNDIYSHNQVIYKTGARPDYMPVEGESIYVPVYKELTLGKSLSTAFATIALGACLWFGYDRIRDAYYEYPIQPVNISGVQRDEKLSETKTAPVPAASSPVHKISHKNVVRKTKEEFPAEYERLKAHVSEKMIGYWLEGDVDGDGDGEYVVAEQTGAVAGAGKYQPAHTSLKIFSEDYDVESDLSNRPERTEGLYVINGSKPVIVWKVFHQGAHSGYLSYDFYSGDLKKIGDYEGGVDSFELIDSSEITIATLSTQDTHSPRYKTDPRKIELRIDAYDLRSGMLKESNGMEYEIWNLYNSIMGIVHNDTWVDFNHDGQFDHAEMARAKDMRIIGNVNSVDEKRGGLQEIFQAYDSSLVAAVIGNFPFAHRDGWTTLNNELRDLTEQSGLYGTDFSESLLQNSIGLFLGSVSPEEFILGNYSLLNLTYGQAQKVNQMSEGRIVQRDVGGQKGWNKVETTGGATMYQGPDGGFRHSVGADPVPRDEAVSRSYSSDGSTVYVEHSDPVTGRTWTETESEPSRSPYDSATSYENSDGSVTTERTITIGHDYSDSESSQPYDARMDSSSEHYEGNAGERFVEDATETFNNIFGR